MPAHPFQTGLVGAALGMNVLKLINIPAIETLNGSLPMEENRQAQEAAREMGLLGIGGSDAHGLHVLGRAYTVFPCPVLSDAELVRALYSGGYWPEEQI